MPSPCISTLQAGPKAIGTPPDLRLGSELFGLLRLADDILAPASLTVRDGALAIPSDPGLGVTLDKDRVAFLARQRELGARHSGLAA